MWLIDQYVAVGGPIPVLDGRYPELMVSIPCVARMEYMGVDPLGVAGAISWLSNEANETSIRPRDSHHCVKSGS